MGKRTRRTDTRDPRRSRARALKLLYQADVRGEDPVALLERVASDPRAAALLDDLDPEEAAELGDGLPADHPDADPEDARITAARARNVPPIDGFTRSLVTGVADRRGQLDAYIQGFARRWAVARMPAVDRNALRLGAYELEHEDTAPAVVINEMVELAKGLSTDDSGRYVNGVLEAIRKDLARTAAAPEPDAPDPATPEPEAPEPDVREVDASEATVPGHVDEVDEGEPVGAEQGGAEQGGAEPVEDDQPTEDSSAQQQLF